MALQVGSHDFLIGRIDGSKLPRILHTNAVPQDRIVHIDYHSHLWTTAADVSGRNHHWIECILILCYTHNVENGGILLIEVGRYLCNNIFLTTDFDDISQLQSWPYRVIFNVDGVLLCHHLSSQNLSIILCLEYRV